MACWDTGFSSVDRPGPPPPPRIGLTSPSLFPLTFSLCKHLSVFFPLPFYGFSASPRALTPSAATAKLNRASCCMNILVFVSREAPLGGGNAEEALVSSEQSSILCLQPSFLGSSLPAVPEPRPRQLGRGGPALSPPHRLRGCGGGLQPWPTVRHSQFQRPSLPKPPSSSSHLVAALFRNLLDPVL